MSRVTIHATAMTILVLAAALPAPVRAQGNLSMRGLVDIVAGSDNDTRYLNTVNTRDSPFDPLRARLFVEGAFETTELYLQFLFSQQSVAPIRFYGGYVQQKLFDRDLYLQAGLLPVNDGTWASHTYSDKNPGVGIPLSYYWKSTLPSRQLPVDLDDLLSRRGGGQTGVNYTDSTGMRGTPYAMMPILYDNCWNYGAFAMGSAAGLEFSAGVTLGAPGAPLASPDLNEDLTLHLRLGRAITPGLKMWVSGARGAYLAREVSPYLPAGKTVNDYYQNLVGVSVDWKWNYLNVLGEGFYNRFDTPLRAGGLSNRSFYVQGAYTVVPGWDALLRYDDLRYGEVANSGGVQMTWDQNVYRIESGVSYRVNKATRVKAVVQATDDGEGFGEYVFPAVQMSMAF